MAGAREQEENIVRRLLTTIDQDAAVSQRKLSEEIGIAVGSVNWYLKRCVSKGLVKLQQAPVKRYLYYLTPHGFEEKARLTGTFLQSSLELYRCGRKECDEFFRACEENGKKIIFLAGASDFAEIAVLSSLNAGGARPTGGDRWARSVRELRRGPHRGIAGNGDCARRRLPSAGHIVDRSQQPKSNISRHPRRNGGERAAWEPPSRAQDTEFQAGA